MSLTEQEMCKTGEGFPRVSGDEPWQTLQRLVIIRFSPRERG